MAAELPVVPELARILEPEPGLEPEGALMMEVAPSTLVAVLPRD